jgi:PAS domain S-box-containing protein
MFAAILALSGAARYFGMQISFTFPIIVVVVGAAWFGGRGPGILVSVLIVAVSAASARQADQSPALPFYFQQASVLALLILVVFLVHGRRVAQERSKRQSDLFRTTLASIGDAVITTDADGNVTLANSIAERIIGVPAADVVGRPLREIYRLQEETTEERIPDIFKTIKDQKEIITFTSSVLLHRPDGSTVPIRDTAAPIVDAKGSFCGSVVVFQDDTTRRSSERHCGRPNIVSSSRKSWKRSGR